MKNFPKIHGRGGIFEREKSTHLVLEVTECMVVLTDVIKGPKE
jgi:hypothetical protein